MMMKERVDELRRSVRRRRQAAEPVVEDAPNVELRLCKPDDDAALDRLAALAEQPLPFGRVVVALVNGELVAALPLGGGSALRDPFAKTAHLLPLLELRAAQLRRPAARLPLVPRLLRPHA
jgi:hypothetical protein